MAVQTERSVLNHLIEMCNDGERGFHAAAEYVKEPALSSLFKELAEQRRQFAAELLPHAQRLGGDAAAEGTRAGTLHRSWMQIKGHLSGHPDHAIVAEAERGERAARHAYEEAINGIVPPTVRGLLERQCAGVQAAHARILALDSKA